MTARNSHSQIVARRGELMAELFLQELDPAYVARPTDDIGADFLIGFTNRNGGINTFAVEVKATEHPVTGKFPIQTRVYDRLAHSNIPGLLLIVDVKHNRLFYARLSPEVADAHRESNTIAIPVTEVNDRVKKELQKELSV